MKKISFLLIIMCFSLNAIALPDYGLWCQGKALLENGDLLEGEISLDLKFEVVRVKKDGFVHAYTAQSVAYFELFDHIKKINRKYISVENKVHPGYERKSFFEVISHGELSFLRQSEYVRRPRATEDIRAPHVYLNSICKHIYYMHDQEEGLLRIQNFRKEVIPRMVGYEEEVNNYIKSCRLTLRKVHEQVRVFNLYNQLCTMNNRLASGSTQETESWPNLR